jgi:hypothetical protein
MGREARPQAVDFSLSRILAFKKSNFYEISLFRIRPWERNVILPFWNERVIAVRKREWEKERNRQKEKPIKVEFSHSQNYGFGFRS